MVVTQLIDSIEAPETIRGAAGERFTVKVITHTEGDGESYLYIGFLEDTVPIGEGVHDTPIGPGVQVTWTVEFELVRTVEDGTTLLYTARVGHLEDETRVQDDSRGFSVLVRRGLPSWVPLAIAAGAVLVVGGLIATRK